MCPVTLRYLRRLPDGSQSDHALRFLSEKGAIDWLDFVDGKGVARLGWKVVSFSIEKEGVF